MHLFLQCFSVFYVFMIFYLHVHVHFISTFDDCEPSEIICDLMFVQLKF